MERREALKNMGVAAAALGTGAIIAMAEGNDKTAHAAPTTGGSKAAADIGYKDGKFVLPPLAYPYESLEPHIDAQTMRLHHDIHHLGYVNGANRALDALVEIGKGSRDASETKHWERELAFHGSGHTLHTIFWRNMSPEPGEASDELTTAIDKDFGGMDQLVKLYTASATSVEASGWAILGYLPLAGRLLVLQAEKHHDITVHGVVPLLVIDVWEHAYYLKYQNKRGDYVDAWWNVVDWADVSKRYAEVAG